MEVGLGKVHNYDWKTLKGIVRGTCLSLLGFKRVCKYC